MPTEIVTEVQDRPGLLADIGELFGKRNINITAAAAFTHNGKGYLHFVVDDAEPATGLLKESGCKIMTVREVLSVSWTTSPGNSAATPVGSPTPASTSSPSTRGAPLEATRK